MDGIDYPNLARLVNNDELWEAVRDFDRILADSRERLLDFQDESPSAKIGHKLHEFVFDHLHLTFVFRFKAKEIARGIFVSLKEKNHVVLFNLARAFVEHTSSLAYQNHVLGKAVTDISSKQDLDQILNSINAHRDVARRLYYGGQGSPIIMKRIHINDLLDALAKLYVEAPSHYERLCEFVHPNYGSNTLVSSGDLASGKIGISTDALAPELRFVREVIEQCADIDAQLIFSSTRALAQISDWVSISSRGGVNVSQIFSLRSAYSGDGRTKDSAIFFSKSRTYHEALMAFYSYMKKEGMVLRNSQTAVIENGFLFKIVSTDRGEIWIKYKITSL